MEYAAKSLLEEAIESWGFTRDGVIAEAEIIAHDRYAWRPAEGARSVAELIRHIAEAGLMATGELTRPDGDFLRVPYTDIVREYAAHVAAVDGKEPLIALLRESFAGGVRSFRKAGELSALQSIRRFDGKYSTRLGWLWHAIDHESYHRGQLALYNRVMGVVPALTRQIHGEG
jgi:uncharacterized damage-inducible protein DinB